MCRPQEPKAGLFVLLILAVGGCATQEPFPYSGIASSREMRLNKDDTSGRIPYQYASKVDWSRYKNVMLEPVAIYSGADGQFSDLTIADKRTLANFMTIKFSEALGARFRFVATAGPDTLRIRLTLTGAETTTPVLATFSRFDIGMGSYNLVQAARDRKGTFSGSVSYAVEIYNASTSRLLQSYVTRQYPKTYDIASTFGHLSAAQTGISMGAQRLADSFTSQQESPGVSPQAGSGLALSTKTIVRYVTISGMIDAIAGGNLAQVKRIDTFQTTHVVPIFGGVGAALMMGINPAVATEVMSGRASVELIQLELTVPLNDMDTVLCHRGDNGTPTTAH